MNAPIQIEIEPLADHPRGAFCCDEQSIQNFFRINAKKDHDLFKQRVFVARAVGDQRPLGFYSLTLMTFTVGMNDEADAKFARHNSIPTIYLSLIARDKNLSEKGLGGVLMEDAFKRCLNVRNDVGAYALTLHAVNEPVAARYEALGFKRFGGEEHDVKIGEHRRPAMFIPLSQVAEGIAAADEAG